ncbi:MAG: hypothetical protein U0821_21300 [Chloroflexota bacterium]
MFLERVQFTVVSPRFRRLALASVILLASGWLTPPAASAQIDPGPPGTVPGGGVGGYLEAAPLQLRGALERAASELDQLLTWPAPEQVRQSPARRRLLELRLLMDFNAYGYDPVLMQILRDAVDDAYEEIGHYQDLAITERVLRTDVPDLLVEQRLVKMNVAMAAVRSPVVREAIDRTLAAPAQGLQPLTGLQVPRLWAIARTQPDPALDSTGNLARLSRAVLVAIRDQGLLVEDVFDLAQEERFHDVRKAIRSVLILADLFPETRDATVEARAAFAGLVSSYGDVNDRLNAYHVAQSIGVDTVPTAAAVTAAFQKAQDAAQTLRDGGALGELIERLAAVEVRHRR